MRAQSKTVLVLPGSQYQVPLIRKVRARGYRAVCADRSPDCAGAKEADEFHPIGLDERERLLGLAQAIRPCGIVTDQTDAGVAVVAWLSEQMGLRGIGVSSAALFTQKNLMREFGRRHGFPTPDCRLCHNVVEAQVAAIELGFPVVIKPVNSQASKGVSRVEDPQGVAMRFADAARYSAGAGVLVEEFIDGEEFTVEGFMAAGGHCTLGISEKRNYPECPMVACSLRYTPENPNFDYEELRRVHDAWMNKTGLAFGMTHAEYKCSRGRYYLIEVAARGGGTRIASDIVPWISGIDCEELMLDAVLDGITQGIDRVLVRHSALLEFFQFPSGVVRSIHGVAEAKTLPGVLDVVLNCSPGGALPALTDGTSRPGYFILQTETEDELSSLREKVLETVQMEMARWILQETHRYGYPTGIEDRKSS